MNTSQTVPDLIAAAQANAKMSEDRIADLQADLKGGTATDAQANDMRAAQLAIELAAVDTFGLFEARMQGHFKRGPFSRKLQAALIAGGRNDLADRLHKYYLAVNVLKHGTGASYRELLNTKTPLFHIKRHNGPVSQDEGAPSIYIDVCVPGFFDGFAKTLLEAHHFLDKR